MNRRRAIQEMARLLRRTRMPYDRARAIRRRLRPMREEVAAMFGARRKKFRDHAGAGLL